MTLPEGGGVPVLAARGLCAGLGGGWGLGGTAGTGRGAGVGVEPATLVGVPDRGGGTGRAERTGGNGLKGLVSEEGDDKVQGGEGSEERTTREQRWQERASTLTSAKRIFEQETTKEERNRAFA